MKTLFNIGDKITAGDIASYIFDTIRPVVGYSLRKLSNISGPVIRARRGIDNKESDFYADEIEGGELQGFATNDGASDVFVTVWYDQFGNNNATQTTAAEQPKIWDSTTGLLTENGRPAIEFDGVDDFLDLSEHSDMFNNVGYAHLFSVNRFDTSTSTQTLFFAATGDDQAAKARVVVSALADNTIIEGGRRLDADSFGSATSAGTISDGEQYLQSSLISYASSDINQYINGLLDGQNLSFQTDGNTSATDSLNSNGINISIGSLSSFNQYDGAIQELIVYTTDQSANRTAIEANINAYYIMYGVLHYRQRVADDGGTFVVTGRDQTVYNSVTTPEMPSLICSCDAYKATKLYNINPA